ncbi:MAG: hypothetical protein H6735_27195 [Alphaproteobacteria bacterium]|nr:hypothetical protein [Alphaproteobacteria bacterium]
MQVPDPLLRVLPELADLPFGAEPLASCASCAMAPRPSDPDAVFVSPTRCCTYHPRLASFLAGRALRRGGVGAERIRQRLRNPDGVSELGIVPPTGTRERWAGRTAQVFGRDPSFACPYWVEGPLGCSIHEDRDAVCRTWHCKVVTGQRGQVAWTAANVLVASLERRLARWCAERAPADVRGVEWLPGDVAERWFVDAARLVDEASDEELRALRTSRVEALVEAAARRAAERDRPLPDVVVPTLASWERRPEGFSVTSFSPFDRVLLPPWIFELLSRLDGERTWRDAVDQASDALGHPIAHDLVWMLWSRGLVGVPVENEGSDIPVLSVLPDD